MDESGLRHPQHAPLPLVPWPAEVTRTAGEWTLPRETLVAAHPPSPDFIDHAQRLAQWLREAAPVTAEVVDRPGSHITLARDENVPGAEDYRLRVARGGITVAARSSLGVGHGIQTLRQLLGAGDGTTCPHVEINDGPRFPWRGLLLDCCRHFVDIDTIHRALELLAYHKMNRFHWHLTEDQGWRLEIRAHPELTAVGAWRKSSEGLYGGFYSQDDAREVVEHAARLGITVVPEIEMPGHCVAALAARPELSCTGGPFDVETRWGIFDDVYCAGNDDVFEFLESVLSEVFELFPGPFVHIGGDECPKARWRACPKCRARIEAEGLADEDELQSWFLRRIGRFVHSKGRRMIGWDEILEGGLPPGAIVQSWRGIDGAVAAARSGHDTIVSPTSHAYFDYGLDLIDLARVYDFDPVPEEVTGHDVAHILGGECNMWTERAPQDTLDTKLFPRLCAMAERLWSRDAQRGFDDFRRRLRVHGRRLQAMGVDMGPETES